MNLDIVNNKARNTTMSTDTTSMVEEYIALGYGHINRIFTKLGRQNILFTEAGKARLTHIYGFMHGVYGATEDNPKMRAFAEKLAVDLYHKLDSLTDPTNKVEIKLNEDGLTWEVPRTKVVLSDDGTFHGFGIVNYHPVQPAVVAEKYKQLNAEGDDEYNQNWDKALEELKIQKHVNPSDTGSEMLSEWTKDGYVYYSYGTVGGLIYHGPAGQEVFSIPHKPSSLWGLHF